MLASMKWYIRLLMALVILLGLWFGLLSMRPSWIASLPNGNLSPCDGRHAPADLRTRLAVDQWTRTLSLPGSWDADFNSEYENLSRYGVNVADMSIVSNALALVHTNMAAVRRLTDSPPPPMPGDYTIEHLNALALGLTRLRALFCASALLHADQGRLDIAVAELFALLRFSQDTVRGGPFMLHQVHCRTSHEALGHLRALAWRQDKTDADLLVEVMHRLERREQTEPALDLAIRGEYVVQCENVRLVYQEQRWIHAYPGQLVRLDLRATPCYGFVAGLLGCRQHSTETNIRYLFAHLLTDRDTSVVYRLLGRVACESAIDLYVTRDPVGRFLAHTICREYLKLCHAHRLLMVDMRATRLLAAIRLHLLTHDALSALDELVPGILDRLPGDPFGPGPLKLLYDAEGRPMVYSIGINEVDDGGQPELDTLVSPYIND